MASFALAASNVSVVSGNVTTIKCNAAITTGLAVALRSSLAELANASDTTLINLQGIAVSTTTVASQYVSVAGDGAIINTGAVLTAGREYRISGSNAGYLALDSDLTTNWGSVFVGYALTTSTLKLQLVQTGVTGA